MQCAGPTRLADVESLKRKWSKSVLSLFHYVIVITTKSKNENPPLHFCHMWIKCKFIWEGTAENWGVYRLPQLIISKIIKHLHLSSAIFPGSLDHRITGLKGLQLFAKINRVASLLKDETKVSETTEILNFYLFPFIAGSN